MGAGQRQAAEYRKAIAEVQAVAKRCAGKPGAVGELGKIAQWLGDQWAGENGRLLELSAK